MCNNFITIPPFSFLVLSVLKIILNCFLSDLTLGLNLFVGSGDRHSTVTPIGSNTCPLGRLLLRVEG